MPESRTRDLNPDLGGARAGRSIATQRGGGSGVLHLWASTLIDLFKTVIEERSRQRIQLDGRLFVRSSGLAAMAGGALWIQVVNGSCANSTNDQGQTVVFGGAGGHFDPNETGRHSGPETPSDEGHAGDLPNIRIGADGRGILEVTTDKVTLESGELSIAGRAIVIHADEDNYTGEPALGGSGPRVACGVIHTLGASN